MPSATRPSGISAADRAKLALAATAMQSVPDATTDTKGIAKKAAALANASPGTLTISIGGSVSLTLPAITGAVYTTDAAVIKNVLTSIADALNKTNARFEELIAKQQTAGQQT